MDNKKLPADQVFSQCLSLLTQLKESGYWPFASPAPCSTERKIIDAVDGAISRLQTAQYYDNVMFGGNRRSRTESPSSVISTLK